MAAPAAAAALDAMESGPTASDSSTKRKVNFRTAAKLAQSTVRIKRTKRDLFEGASLTVMLALSVLCFIVGGAVFIIPARWVESGLLVQPTGSSGTINKCQEVTPENTPFTPVDNGTSRSTFVHAWESYVVAIATRPEGVRAGCEPMRFPATSAYQGVAVVWHGFSSCPQEMSHLGPALASKGFDVIFPLMVGHGNAVVYEADAPYFLWAYLALAFALVGLVIMGCCHLLPCCTSRCKDERRKDACCGARGRMRCIYASCLLLAILAIVSLTAVLIVTFGKESVFCLSLSFVDGVGPGCGGMSEYNDNLPTSPDDYRTAINEISRIVALAPGTHVVSGLSGGGAAAIYEGMTTKPDGSALFARQLFVAPYLDVAIIGPAISPAIAFGLGKLKLDFGADCRIERRGAGKAGYCNYRINQIDAMRQVGQEAYDNLVVLPGTSVEVLKVQGDGTVTNSDITLLANKYEQLNEASTSRCVLTHVDSRHSPLSMWNYVHMDVQLEWVPELTCQIANFLGDGTAMPTTGEQYNSEDVCYSGCNMGNCSFDCETDSFFQCP